MAKIFIGAGAALLLAILASYLLISPTVIFSKVTHLSATSAAAERAFYSEVERNKWWPAKGDPAINNDKEQNHRYGKNKYAFPQQTYSGSTIHIYHNDKKLNSTIHFVSFKTESTAIIWKAEFAATNNPFKRMSNYVAALAIKENMADILDAVKEFLAKPEGLYGHTIIEEKVKDTILMSTRWTSATYPSTEMIYGKIDMLKKYISINGGMETNNPMLNISEERGMFNTMVAIPVNKELPENEAILVKKMVAGRILSTIVTGGMRSPAAALKKIEQYIDDHKITSPAIPFESLVTNRMKEKDTLKWVTKVYYPIY